MNSAVGRESREQVVDLDEVMISVSWGESVGENDRRRFSGVAQGRSMGIRGGPAGESGWTVSDLFMEVILSLKNRRKESQSSEEGFMEVVVSQGLRSLPTVENRVREL